MAKKVVNSDMKKFRVMAFWGPQREGLDSIHVFADHYEVEDDGKTVSFYNGHNERVASVASWVSVEAVGKED